MVVGLYDDQYFNNIESLSYATIPTVTHLNIGVEKKKPYSN